MKKLENFKAHTGTVCMSSVIRDFSNYILNTNYTEELLYDNKDFNYVKDFEFTVVQTRTIKISIEIPEDQSQKASPNSTGLISKSINQGCVGVLIEEMSTPKTGF